MLSLQPKHPQPGHMIIIVNILNNIIYNCRTKKNKNCRKLVKEICMCKVKMKL
jgi:hypothetical protein